MPALGDSKKRWTMSSDTSKRQHLFDLWFLCGIAFLLRLAYLLSPRAEVGLIKTARYSPDAYLYQSIADNILSGEWHSSLGLLKVGTRIRAPPGRGWRLLLGQTWSHRSS